MPKPIRKNEDAVHVPILVWIRENVSSLVWHTPNEGRRGFDEQRKQKARGLLSGVADICFVLDDGRFGSLEVKREGSTDSAVSDNQRRFGRMVTERNGLWAVVSSKDEAIQVCREWGVIRSHGAQVPA